MISAFAPLCPGFSPLLRQFGRTRCSSLGIASVRPPAPSGRREGKCTAFPNSLGCSSPVRILSGTCRSSHRTPIFPLRTRLAKFTIVSEQFKNSSFTYGHSSPLSPDSLFSIPHWRPAKAYRRQRAKQQPTRSAVLLCCCCCCHPFALPLGEAAGGKQSHTENHGSRAILAFSPESFWLPYFVNEPRTRGALHALTRAAKRCPLSENLFRYMKKNPQQNLLLFAPFQAVKPERVKQYRKFSTLHPQPRSSGGGQKRTIHLLAAHL